MTNIESVVIVCFSVDLLVLNKMSISMRTQDYTVAIVTAALHRISAHHMLNDSSSHVLTATSISYGKAKNSTPTESKPLI